MSKEASRIRRVIDRLKSREDIAEILKMAQLETAIAIFADDGKRFDRSVAIYEAAEDALEVASVRMQAPRYPAAA
jgi:hypothetical protein